MVSSPPCRGGEVSTTRKADLARRRHQGRQQVRRMEQGAYFRTLTMEQLRESLNATFARMGDGGSDDEAEDGPRQSQKWLRESTAGMIARNELFEGASVVVIIIGALGAIAGEITAAEGPGLKSREFRLKPWGCEREIVIDVKTVRSIRLAPSHTWAEKQIVARKQKAKFEPQETNPR